MVNTVLLLEYLLLDILHEYHFAFWTALYHLCKDKSFEMTFFQLQLHICLTPKTGVLKCDLQHKF